MRLLWILVASLGLALPAGASDPTSLQPPDLTEVLTALSPVACAGDLACSARKKSTLSLSRPSLSRLVVSPSTGGGKLSFSLSPKGDAYPQVSFAAGSSATRFPATLSVKGSGDTGSPAAGGLSTLRLTYTKSGSAPVSQSLKTATFGVSCYSTNLESDWGTPPSSCRSIRINGVTYQGAETNPYGLKGRYCRSFIAMTRLQGSSALNDGRFIQYLAGKLVVVDAIRGADNTPVIANKTVARDRSIIPRGGVKVSLAGIGNTLLANDTGGAILGYRIDFYRGSGAAVCRNFSNARVIGACNPANAACPGLLP